MTTTTTRPVCAAAIALVKQAEGLYLTAYRCPAGVPTIGYGHTAGVTEADIGWRRITEPQAEALLADDLTKAAAAVDRLVTVPINADQRGALASFVFNLGAGSLVGSTLLKLLNRRDYAGAAGQFGAWVKASVRDKKTGIVAKVTLPGLVTRRAAERALFERRA
ncbi:lysozyme [Azospirillum doebereinerae]|uniref:Lysozyme n=1 Tax=Azospirillum doebereinerae TaxID=92933 RepID=A0A3S0UXL8_9PROT|nr:lysozyme [Azospirillum doebereinerae]RUQ59752.1 lysozyme [Azospirillum doebereinerae]